MGVRWTGVVGGFVVAVVLVVAGTGGLAAGVPPLPPTNLVANVFNPATAILYWQGTDLGETGFEVERSPYPDGPFVQAGTTGPGIRHFGDGGHGGGAAGETIYWRVRSVGADGASAWSEVATATIPASGDDFALFVLKGAIKDTTKAGKDSFIASGTTLYPFNALSFFDPETESLFLTVGNGEAPLMVRVPAGSPGWVVKADNSYESVYTWKSAKGARPQVKFSLNWGEKTWSLSIRKADFPLAPGLSENVIIYLGRNLGASSQELWTLGKPGILKYLAPK